MHTKGKLGRDLRRSEARRIPGEPSVSRRASSIGADGKGPSPVPFDMTVEVRWPESTHVRQSGLGIEPISVAP
jgi:hypothetical protein